MAALFMVAANGLEKQERLKRNRDQK